ncbi:hypothetical protein ABIE69_000623 [Rhodobacteraceae bacterium MBR-64]
MATIVLAAAGSSFGAGFGGTVLGLSGAVIGRAAGAAVGRVIDQRLLGSGSEAVEAGRVDRFRLMGAGEGTAIARVHGRMRVAGQVIWASKFLETAQTAGGGGKGAPSAPKVTRFSYSVSLALALCEGEIVRVGRIWADGVEVVRDDLNLRVYAGGEDQLPDPLIEAIEGARMVPAYRGTAYVVIEDLQLGAFGNRVPQLSFEVVRAAQGPGIGAVPDLGRGIEAVALMPGTGDYALATTPVHFEAGPGVNRSANINTPSGKADLVTSMEVLAEELPRCKSVSLVVSWFGDDLRCGACDVQPKIEQDEADGVGMAWSVAGRGRGGAPLVPLLDGRPVYGGTPADRSVIEAIREIQGRGMAVMFYPFLLMEQMAGNTLPDPWSGEVGQAVLPWRGRITTSLAPGLVGSPDRTAAAEAEVAAFFGAAAPGDFAVQGEDVVYSGPDEWSYRRFILHYAHLCKAAGGVEAFCVGSEMRALTQVRGAGNSFPAVAQFRQLAAEVRAILGAGTKISYAADWSEYFGYDAGGGNRYFHLDPFWADENVDFIGIDNYMPVADWRDGEAHADAGWGTIYNLDYLKANIEGGEGFDWFYPPPEEEAAQLRAPITDGAYNEPWVFRFKDLRGWWENDHFERLGGVRQAQATDWQPMSKPFWFTEFGCAAIDKGANQPNRFLDPKSSESGLPKFSNGRRDDLMQMQYLRAVVDYWGDAARNPVSPLYGGAMIDMGRAHVWAWDARPWPEFPANLDLWADGGNYARGHWITGRAASQPLADVVAEICWRAGLRDFDVSGLFGVVRGFGGAQVESARAILQPLMLAYGFDAVERDGVVRFAMRGAGRAVALDEARLAVTGQLASSVEAVRAPEAEVSGRVRVGFIEADGSYEAGSAEAIFPDEVSRTVSGAEVLLVLTRAEAQGIAERWLAEARVARDGLRFALPPSNALGAGDVVRLGGLEYRLDRVEQAEARLIDAVRVEDAIYQPSDEAEQRVVPRAFVAPVPVFAQFMDLPLMRGDEVAHAPHLAVTARPWPGSVAVYSALADAGYAVNTLIAAPAVLGVTETVLEAARPGIWDRGAALRVKMAQGALASVAEADVLNGANLMAVGDRSSDRWELFQFAEAVLVAPQTWDLRMRLRGQLGSDAVMPEAWGAGSIVVLITPALRQIELAPTERGLVRNYRIGPSGRALDDPSFQHRVEAFQGIGLRPYAPVHLRARAAGGDLAVSWVRRTRIDGDRWTGGEVPLGEEAEAYVLRVIVGGAIRREVSVTTPQWTYPAAMQAADGATGGAVLAVAQISAQFGAGAFQEIVIND